MLEVALPDSGRGITGWWQEHRRDEAPDWTLREYQELMRTSAPAASTHRTLTALSLDTRKPDASSDMPDEVYAVPPPFCGRT